MRSFYIPENLLSGSEYGRGAWWRGGVAKEGLPEVELPRWRARERSVRRSYGTLPLAPGTGYGSVVLETEQLGEGYNQDRSHNRQTPEVDQTNKAGRPQSRLWENEEQRDRRHTTRALEVDNVCTGGALEMRSSDNQKQQDQRGRGTMRVLGCRRDKKHRAKIRAEDVVEEGVKIPGVDYESKEEGLGMLLSHLPISSQRDRPIATGTTEEPLADEGGIQQAHLWDRDQSDPTRPVVRLWGSCKETLGSARRERTPSTEEPASERIYKLPFHTRYLRRNARVLIGENKKQKAKKPLPVRGPGSPGVDEGGVGEKGLWEDHEGARAKIAVRIWCEGGVGAHVGSGKDEEAEKIMIYQPMVIVNGLGRSSQVLEEGVRERGETKEGVINGEDKRGWEGQRESKDTEETEEKRVHGGGEDYLTGVLKRLPTLVSKLGENKERVLVRQPCEKNQMYPIYTEETVADGQVDVGGVHEVHLFTNEQVDSGGTAVRLWRKGVTKKYRKRQKAEKEREREELAQLLANLPSVSQSLSDEKNQVDEGGAEEMSLFAHDEGGVTLVRIRCMNQLESVYMEEVEVPGEEKWQEQEQDTQDTQEKGMDGKEGDLYQALEVPGGPGLGKWDILESQSSKEKQAYQGHTKQASRVYPLDEGGVHERLLFENIQGDRRHITVQLPWEGVWEDTSKYKEERELGSGHKLGVVYQVWLEGRQREVVDEGGVGERRLWLAEEGERQGPVVRMWWNENQESCLLVDGDRGASEKGRGKEGDEGYEYMIEGKVEGVRIDQEEGEEGGFLRFDPSPIVYAPVMPVNTSWPGMGWSRMLMGQSPVVVDGQVHSSPVIVNGSGLSIQQASFASHGSSQQLSYGSGVQMPFVDSYAYWCPIVNCYSYHLPPITSLTKVSPLLYRVYDDCSVSQHQWFGFASGLPTMPYTPLDFHQDLARHVDWRCRLTTPFISMTDSPHAVDWQVAIRAKVKRRNIMIAIIDTAMLLHHCGARMWEMTGAMRHYGISPPGRLSWVAFESEYICALRVPSVAIVRLCTKDDFRTRAWEYLRRNYGMVGEDLGQEFGNVVLQGLQQRPSVTFDNQVHFL